MIKFHAVRRAFPPTAVVLTGIVASMTLIAVPMAAPSASALLPHSSATCAGTNATSPSYVGMAATGDDGGYWIADSDGRVVVCGDAPFLGQLSTTPNAPIVGIAATPDERGYYLVASDGGIFTYGDAHFQGSTGALRLNRPVVGMAVDPATGGYWLVASDGGIFAFGAPFYGSTGAMQLNRPVVGMAQSNKGSGYWLVAADGGIFAFSAPFLGSTGAMTLNKPVVGMSADLGTNGYWLVAADGGIFSYNAPFYGSTGAIVLNRPVVGMESNGVGTGYRFVASDGGIFNYGASGFFGSAAVLSQSSPQPVPPTGCTVTLSDTSPNQNQLVIATVTSDVPNTQLELAIAFQSGTVDGISQTDPSGHAIILFSVGMATIGYAVSVTATVGPESCQTSFTPI